MAKSLMVMGTSPKSGKSFFISALCRIFSDDGYKTVPFKAQSITSNVKYTKEGFEIDAQTALLAEIAMTQPDIRMNPVLLKPCGDDKFEVTVCGKLMGDMTLAQYAASFDDIMPEVIGAYKSLLAENDIVLIEADGTPAEGLRYNIGGPELAEMLAVPIIIISDYLTGGAFSSAYGSFAFADGGIKSFIKGFIINNLDNPEREHERNIAKLSEMVGLSFVSGFKRVDIGSLTGSHNDMEANVNEASNGIVKANPFFSGGEGAGDTDFRGDYGNAEEIFQSDDSVSDAISVAGTSAFGFDENVIESNNDEPVLQEADAQYEQIARNEYINSLEIEDEEDEDENIFAKDGLKGIEEEVALLEASENDEPVLLEADALYEKIAQNEYINSLEIEDEEENIFAKDDLTGVEEEVALLEASENDEPVLLAEDALYEKIAQNEYINSLEIEDEEENIFAKDDLKGIEEEVALLEASESITNFENDPALADSEIYIDDMLLENVKKQVADINETVLKSSFDNQSIDESLDSSVVTNDLFGGDEELAPITEEKVEHDIDYGKESDKKWAEKQYNDASVEDIENEIDILKANIENEIHTKQNSASGTTTASSISSILENIEKRISAINVSHSERVLEDPVSHDTSYEDLEPLSYQDVNKELFDIESVDKKSDTSNDFSERETFLDKASLDGEKSFVAESDLNISDIKESFESCEEIQGEVLADSAEISESLETNTGKEESFVNIDVKDENMPVSTEFESSLSSFITNTNDLDTMNPIDHDEAVTPLSPSEDELDKMFSFDGWEVSTNVQPTSQGAPSKTPVAENSHLKDSFSYIDKVKTDNFDSVEIPSKDSGSFPSLAEVDEPLRTPSFSNAPDTVGDEKPETLPIDNKDMDDMVNLEKELKQDMEFLSEKDEKLIENVYSLENKEALIQTDNGLSVSQATPDIENDDTVPKAVAEDITLVGNDVFDMSSNVNVTIIDLPHGTYKSGFDELEDRGMTVSYVSDANDFGTPDFIVVPDTLKPMSDLVWMRNNGLESAIISSLLRRSILLGICGGFHTFSESIQDPHRKDIGGEIEGMKLFKMKTVLGKDRKITKVRGIFKSFEGLMSPLNGKNFEGNAILSSRIVRSNHKNISVIIDKENGAAYKDGICEKNVLGINVFGILRNHILLDVITNIMMDFKDGKNIAAAYLNDNRVKLMSFASKDEVRLSVSHDEAVKISQKLENNNESSVENADKPDIFSTSSEVYNNYDNVNGIISESYDAFGGIVSFDEGDLSDKASSVEIINGKNIDALAKHVKENLDIKKIYEIILKGV